MITKNCLKELLKEELKKVNKKKLSNWNNEISTDNIVKGLNVALSELIFTNFESFKKFILEFYKYIRYLGLSSKKRYFVNNDSLEIQFNDSFNNLLLYN